MTAPKEFAKPVQFVCTDKARHQRRYPRVSFQANGGIGFKCASCGRDLQMRADRFASVLTDLGAAGIAEVDISALPH